MAKDSDKKERKTERFLQAIRRKAKSKFPDIRDFSFSFNPAEQKVKPLRLELTIDGHSKGEWESVLELKDYITDEIKNEFVSWCLPINKNLDKNKGQNFMILEFEIYPSKVENFKRLVEEKAKKIHPKIDVVLKELKTG